MQASKVRLVVPHGLKTLLEGASRAAIEKNPHNIAEFFTLYFQELLSFRKGHPGLDITELVEKFEFVSENGNEGLEEETSEHTDTWFSEEPKQREKGTDTEEDQLLEEPEIQYSSKITQHPSVASLQKATPRLDRVELHALGDLNWCNSPSLCSLMDVATSVQTLYEDSQTSENELTPVEGAEDASAVLAAETSMASSGAGQPPPHRNVWTLFCLSDLRQGQKSPPPPLSPAGAGAPYSQAALSPSRGEDEPRGQLSQASAPIYDKEESNRRDAPPFILVGSRVQKAEDWKPLPGHAVFACGAGAGRRLTAFPVPGPAGEGTDRASPRCDCGEKGSSAVRA
ncbi:LOW QUALITY PROTEIN: calcium-binding tyrosine phosphorylation-regulated protein [Rhynochetos jubatus]